MSPEKLIGYVRDAGCVLVGLGGIVWQIYTGHPNALEMSACMGLLGFTGGIRAWQLKPARSSGGGRSRSSRSRPRASSSPSSTPDGDR